MFATQVQKIVPEHEAWIAIIAEAPGLDVEDLLDRSRGGRIDLEDLVGLLLILGEEHLGRAVTDEVLDLGKRIGGVQTDGYAAHGDGGQVEDDPFGSVLGVDGNAITHVDTERQQAVGRELDEIPGVVPRLLAPDAEILLPHRDMVWCRDGAIACHRCNRDRAWGPYRYVESLSCYRHSLPLTCASRNYGSAETTTPNAIRSWRSSS